VLQKLRASSPSLSSKAQGFLLSAKPEFHCELILSNTRKDVKKSKCYIKWIDSGSQKGHQNFLLEEDIRERGQKRDFTYTEIRGFG
jgi:hypothetical protein